MTANEVLEKIKENKRRITPGRQRIVEAICEASAPLAADTLIKKIGMNKTSIYREIAFLLRLKIIQEVDFGDRIKRYELRDLKHHHHLICLRCKNVQDISFTENLEWEEKRIKKLKKFQVVRHDLEFFGYCQKCISK